MLEIEWDAEWRREVPPPPKRARALRARAARARFLFIKDVLERGTTTLYLWDSTALPYMLPYMVPYMVPNMSC